MIVGLRIDVDTFRGTRLGVPNLCRVLNENSTKATFYFSVGPDNMGRHLWRLLRPAFLMKMLRSGAPRLYGWDIIIRGTFWPGQIIGRKLSDIIRKTSDSGHEIGFHAWDHHAWQSRIDRMDAQSIRDSIERGVRMMTEIIGKPPATSADPGWKCNEATLTEKGRFPFKYNSDCRGTDIFLPVVNGQPITQPQIPVTLPTYDELAGRNGISDRNYHDYIFGLLKPDGLNVLTIHAEVEGIAKLHLFAEFIRRIRRNGHDVLPLETVFSEVKDCKYAEIRKCAIEGRDGWVAVQGNQVVHS